MAESKTKAKKKFAVEEGAMSYTDVHGNVFEPVACGEHRSIAINVTSTDDEPEPAAGFQPDCEDCISQLTNTLDSASRASQIEIGAGDERRANR